LLVKVFVTPRKGILDPQGRAVEQSLKTLGFAGVAAVRVGRYIVLELDALRRSPMFESLERELPELRATLSSVRSVTLGVNLGPDLMPESATILGLGSKPIQGRQAPAVIYSMASSSAADAPRGVAHGKALRGSGPVPIPAQDPEGVNTDAIEPVDAERRERVRDRPFADQQVARSSEGRDGKLLRIDLEDSQIVRLVDSDEARWIVRPVLHCHGNARRARDDVRVGHDRAVRAHDESGAEPGSGTLPRAAAKELLEHVSGNSLDDLRLYGDDRRRNTRHGLRDCSAARCAHRAGRCLDLC